MKIKTKMDGQNKLRQSKILSNQSKVGGTGKLKSFILILFYLFVNAPSQHQNCNNVKTSSSCIRLPPVASALEAGATNFSTTKPSLILIAPQILRSSMHSLDSTKKIQNQQLVAVVNNNNDLKADRLLSGTYNKLELQVREANSPSGQPLYSHVFDYIQASSAKPYELIPVKLDLPSTTRSSSPLNSLPSDENFLRSSISPQVVISIRKHHSSSDRVRDEPDIVTSAPIAVESVSSVDGKRNFGIVQTDKPVYKPSDNVKLRMMVVNEELRPVVSNELKLQVKNPQNVTVEEIRFPKFNQTSLDANNRTQNERQINDLLINTKTFFFDHEFVFPDDPMLGVWTANLIHTDPIADSSIKFEVREYVLPTFEVKYDLPKYILPHYDFINGSIIVKHHYGKPVRGKAFFKFGFARTNQEVVFVARSSIKFIDDNTGRVEFKLNLDKFKNYSQTIWNSGHYDKRLIVESTVIESGTSEHQVTQDSSCVFIKHGHRVSFEDAVSDFKPGFCQTLTLKVTQIQTNKPAFFGTKIIAQFIERSTNGTLLATTQDLVPINSHDAKLTQIIERYETEATVLGDGLALLKMCPSNNDDVADIRVNVKWVGLSSCTYTETPTISNCPTVAGRTQLIQETSFGTHLMRRHDSKNGWISITNKVSSKLEVGQTFNSTVDIHNTNVGTRLDRIFFIIVARGQILLMDLIDDRSGLIKFVATKNMIPSVRLVVMALTNDPKLLYTDSMRFNINEELACNMSIKFEADAEVRRTFNQLDENIRVVRPGEKGNLVINARSGDQLSLIGIDAALKTLNNRQEVSALSIVDRIKRLDLGCGFGGGKDSADVFLNAGLMYFNGHNEFKSIQPSFGTSCLTTENNAKLLNDLASGYMNQAVYIANSGRTQPASQQSKPVLAIRKREVKPEAILHRYQNGLYKSCCFLGTLEDIPQKRDCNTRAKIVAKYMQAREERCHKIYLDCCRHIFGEQVSLSAIGHINYNSETPISRKFSSKAQAIQETDSQFKNLGFLEEVEALTLVRSNFHETWLFQVVDVGSGADNNNGLQERRIPVEFPHSITLWTVNGLALNREHFLCIIKSPVLFSTFKDLFVKLTLPYKVVQGEQVDMVATIFNYADKDKQAVIFMHGLDNLCSEAQESGQISPRRQVTIQSKSSASLIFPMIPLQVGKYKIKIAVISDFDSDVIEQELNVVAKGRPVVDETTFSLDPTNSQRRGKRSIQAGNLVDDIDTSKKLQRSIVRLLPTRESENIVPQTHECVISAVGDKLGNSVETSITNVENLIRLPTGSGDQVLIMLGPTLYSSKYLSATKNLPGDMRWRAIGYINSGYKTILNFRKVDGGFSTFESGQPSIWLTASVLKLFCQIVSTPFVNDQVKVDRGVIRSGLEWLLEQQNNATWTERSSVYHRDISGGTLRSNALTSYVTITLNECSSLAIKSKTDEFVTTGGYFLKVEPKLQSNAHQLGTYLPASTSKKLFKAVKNAEDAIASDSDKAFKDKNPYALALSAYALSYNKPQSSFSTLRLLMNLADKSFAKNHISWRGSNQVETASYALLTMIQLDEFAASSSLLAGSSHGLDFYSDSISIFNWLTFKRSFQGSYESLQDTVAGLEALSKYATIQSDPNLGKRKSLLRRADDANVNLMCNVTVRNKQAELWQFEPNTAHLLKTFKLDPFNLFSDPEGSNSEGELIEFVTSGTGIATASVKLRYNVYQDEDELCRFDIESEVDEWRPPFVAKPEVVGHKKESQSADDDFLKSFENSMLAELNLFDAGTSAEHMATINRPALNISKRSTPKPKLILRLRRQAPADKDTTWTQKIVSTIKSKLPWVSKHTTTTIAPSRLAIESQKQTSTEQPRQVSRFPATKAPLAVPIRQTSRRSTASGDRLQGIFDDNVRLNNLSEDFMFNSSIRSLEINSSADSGSKLNDTKSIANNSNRLILLLKVCVRHLSSQQSPEMAVIEIGILSGFVPNEADLDEILKDPLRSVNKFEVSSDKSVVLIYMQQLPSSVPFCFQFRLIRESLVSNLQSGYISVYEYYKPSVSCSSFYTATRISDLIDARCDATGNVCQCATQNLCPSTERLKNMAERSAYNSTRARESLLEYVCSSKVDFVTVANLVSIKLMESGKVYRIGVKPKYDLKGNLTELMDEQRRQRLSDVVRKPSIRDLAAVSSAISRDIVDEPTVDGDEPSPLEIMTLYIDATCLKNDPLLLHFAHESLWRQGGELIISGRADNIERRYHKVAPKTAQVLQSTSRRAALSPASGNLHQTSFSDASNYQYSLSMTLDKSSIIYDVAYQSSATQRQGITNLLRWLELKSRRSKLC